MAETARTYRALLIGNAEFPGDPEQLRTLLGPPTDVPLLAAALTAPDTGLHRSDAVATVLEETTQHIRDALEWFFTSAHRHEQLLFYYSGHGLLDPRNRLRLCARDTTVERLQARSLDLEFIDDLMHACPARSIVTILDCCFSGAAAVKGLDPAARLAGHGRFVMTSSSHADTSADAEAAGAASPFTRHLVTGLTSGAASRDGLVTADDVYRYVYGRLRASGQVPHRKTEAGVGAIPLARRPVREARTNPVAESAPTGGDAVPLDVRPVLTSRGGRRTRLATYTDFSGVLHVRLPRRDALLTTHRDDLVAAAEGEPVTAKLYEHPMIAWRDIHPRVRGSPEAELPVATADGAVSFALPPGAGGTVVWRQRQVRAFRQAAARGRWPGTPRVRSPAPEEYRADSGYRRLRTAFWRMLCWLSAVVFQVFVVADAALDGRVWNVNVISMASALAIVVSLIQTLRWLGEAGKYLRLRGLLRSSGLYAIPMVMETGLVEHVTLGGGGFGLSEIADHRPWAWLRYEGIRPQPWRDDDGDPPPGEAEVEWPALSVPLMDFHMRVAKRFNGPMTKDVDERAAAPSGPRLEHVKVIGVPRPGRWVVIHTANGMLWPRAKAR